MAFELIPRLPLTLFLRSQFVEARLQIVGVGVGVGLIELLAPFRETLDPGLDLFGPGLLDMMLLTRLVNACRVGVPLFLPLRER